jgi:energy-coupling factor transporter ATP-binding protein EcfA2
LIKSLFIGHLEAHFEVPTTPMVVVIGPNNSGKSLLVRELRGALFQSDGSKTTKVLKGVTPPAFDENTARVILDGTRGRRVPARTVEGLPPGSNAFKFSSPRFDPVGRNEETLAMPDLVGNSCRFDKIGPILSLHVPAIDRQHILSRANSEDILPLASLLYDRPGREELAKMVRDAIGYEVLLDAAPLKPATVRLGATRLPPKLEESWCPKAREFLEGCPDLESFSDGIRCFVGILAAFSFGDFRLYTIDEPEAFLHPPMARELGRLLSRKSAECEAVTVASTHSPDFLMGCIQSGKAVTVLRLTYENQVGTARVLEANALKEMMQRPLTRSSNVLAALFHRGAVVCEADADRSFYEEINLRLQLSERGVRDVEFLNAQNCQTIEIVITPLRKMGLPAAAVVDLDAINPQGGLDRLLGAGGVPSAELASMIAMRQKAWNDCRGSSEKEKNQNVKNGVGGFQDRTAIESLIQAACKYGIFLVPGGALEDWLSGLGANRSSKKEWLVDVFERMGSDPGAAAYVRPANDDVWAFVDRISAWINDSRRLGMP